jgi:hypothetical protein
MNLKDLLPLLPPSLRRLFESGPLFTPLFLCRIVLKSAIFCQNAAEYGTEFGLFCNGFYEHGPGLAARKPSQRVPITYWPERREHHQRTPQICRKPATAFTSASLIGY